MIAHCGAQTTADTVALAAARSGRGAEAVAVIAPPYFQFDDDALLAHFVAAARACAPLPFYVYELEKASGYAIPRPGRRTAARDGATTSSGMKVSDAPFAKVQPYLLDGLDVYIGAEALIGQGLAAGAAGAVSGLASAFPEVVVDAVRSGDSTAAGELRAIVDRYPRHAALKAVVRSRGVPMREDVRGAAARPHGRRSGAELLVALSSLAELVDRAAARGRGRRRAARRRLPARAPARARAGRRRQLGLGRRSGLRLRFLGHGELRPQLVRRRRRRCAGRARRRRRSARSPSHPARSASRRFMCFKIAAMLHCRRFSPRPSRRHPKRRQGGGADSVHEKGGIRACERVRNHAAAGPGARRRARRTRSSSASATPSRSAGGTWDGHEPWGRRRLAYEIDHKAEAVYHLLLFTLPAGDARRDHARPQDHRRRHAPRRLPARQGRPDEGAGAGRRGRARRGRVRSRR